MGSTLRSVLVGSAWAAGRTADITAEKVATSLERVGSRPWRAATKSRKLNQVTGGDLEDFDVGQRVL